MASEQSERIEKLADIVAKTADAADQEEYEGYYDRFFELLDDIDKDLESRSFLNGDTFSAADEELYNILVKWDVVDFFALRLNRNRLKDFKNLWPYAKNIYQKKGGKEKTDFEKIKTDYYGNLDEIKNPYHIIPLGPDTSEWEA